LGIAETADKREIKRAYAKLIKQHHPEDDAAAFQSIREAYDRALVLAEYAQEEAVERVHSEGQLHAGERVAPPDRPIPSESPRDSVEKERVRDVQSERINAVLTRLIGLLRQDEHAAIEFCRSTLQDEFFQALDVRYEFEGQLLLGLLQANVYSAAFVDYLAGEFGWDIDIYRSGRMVLDHFGGDARFSGAFYAVVQPYLRDLIRRSLATALKSTHPRSSAEELATLDKLLFGAPDETELATYCKQRSNRALIQSAHLYLTTHKFVTPQFSLVPPQTLRWLVDHIIVRPLAEPAAEAAHRPERQGFRFPFWAIGILLVALSRIPSMIGDHSSPLQSPAYTAARQELDAVSALQLSANNNDPDAQYRLALKYLRGESPIAKDLDKGLEWLNRAAEQDYAPAQETLGIAYYSGAVGRKDQEAAIGLLTAAAESGRAEATFWLATAFAQGGGVERDDAQAQRYLDRSIELGSTEGMRVRGLELLYGRGRDQDLAKGVEYLKTAAEKGNANASYQLAHEYLSGERLEIDYTRAREGLESLSARSIPLVQLWLSQLYEKGLGVEADASRGRQLLAAARQSAPPETVNQFAWDLVTIPNEGLRNGKLAVNLMEGLLADPKNSNVQRLDTLAAAYAEAGDFVRAVATEQDALERLPVDAPPQTRPLFESRVKLYESGKTLSGVR
jgi:TPR repeat protein